ncbi:M12 family metallopeptidase [uncultured Mucilaginibacter sp.]|uniref:M12 family metallopeptidase n=1 Tax=uncultured Mucilaginibacter sp. TaxID=797541 RepID=UPI0025CE96B7|nr:M12 family metallopeptidase [uncultured Mucilaginibacter sp.]
MQKLRLFTIAAMLICLTACEKGPEAEIQDTVSQQEIEGPGIATPGNPEGVDEPDSAIIADEPVDPLDFTIPKVCLDKVIAGEDTSDVETNGVFVRGNKWPVGATLKVYFINGSSYLRGKVMEYARYWSRHANIRFVKTNNKAQSDIRVGFKINGDKGSWSYIGSYANQLKGKQTMNYGWFNRQTEERELRRTIVHEFGHAIGLGHEQSNPDADINWNKPAVYEYYMGPPNNWTREQVNSNVFFKYRKKDVRNTTWDKESIMQYPIDAAFTRDGLEIGFNRNLSDKDKAFIAKIYPAGNN